MKCKNCGANFPIRELNCPYCNTVNPKGWLQKIELDRANAELEATQAKEVVLRRRLVNHVLNRAILVEILVMVLFFAGVVGYFFLEDRLQTTSNHIHMEEINAHLEELYTQQRFGEMSHYISQRHLYPQADPKYVQMVSISWEYEAFQESRMTYYEQQAAGQLQNDDVSSLLKDIHDVLLLPAEQDLDPKNLQLCQTYQQEAEVFARVILKLDDAQVEQLYQKYVYSDVIDPLTEYVMEGGGQDVH